MFLNELADHSEIMQGRIVQAETATVMMITVVTYNLSHQRHQSLS